MAGLPLTFHPIIRSWFTETYGKPTAVQAEAWPLIEQGKHVLALAPTGSGKTLTAFLSAISRFCTESGTGAAFHADKLTVLYISPLKALNEDIKRNLLEPLAAIRSCFERESLAFPDIRVETRSGDTPQAQRRRFLSHPPSILSLTPESLAILLLSAKGRQTLSTVKYVILDEIHAVLGNKRGSYLSCQVDRLAQAAGEFQRVSLSATVRLPEIAAEFTGGLDANKQKRPVEIVAPATEKKIEFTIAYPDLAETIASSASGSRIDKYGKRYTGLINYILNRIQQGTTILVFTDSRRRAERLSYYINEEAPIRDNPVAFAHHGSLSKELRLSVEKRLAAGSLPCVVATASLELGIDIGSVDEVILAGSPGSVSQALQRIGRSGHGVGKVSHGKLFPFHGLDLLHAAALKSAVEERDIEAIHPIENPLDILAQTILALCTEKPRNIDELYAMLQGFYIFKNLNRDSYLRTVRMLAGLHCSADGEVKGRLRELKPRIYLDSDGGETVAGSNSVAHALDGSLLLLYSSGGVIANRGMFSLRLTDGTKIGELDEEFVWERRLGDRFNFGGRGWKITAIGAESVEARPLDSASDFMPFWKADTVFRSPILTSRVLAILDCFNAGKSISDLPEKSPELAALDSFLDSQRRIQDGVPLSDSRNIAIEILDTPENQSDFYSAVIHSFRGGAVNYPFTLALAAELEKKISFRVESFSNDDSILFLIPRACECNVLQLMQNALMSLHEIPHDNGGLYHGERLFRNRLESSGVFGANFREAAERSLLLPKAGFGKRTPLWIMRQRSKRLFDAVISEDGFPVTAEAWRSCLNDMFDMEGFRDLLGAIKDGSVAISFFRTSLPSPFARDMVRQETNTLIYEYDERKDMTGAGTAITASLSDRVIMEALGDAALRPPLPVNVIADFEARLRRELPGWAPDDALSLCEWVKERIAIPLDEWKTLCGTLPPSLQQELSAGDSGQGYCGSRLFTIQLANSAIASVVHRDWEKLWKTEALALLGPWLRYEGPVSALRITEVFGVSAAEAEDAINALAEVDEIVKEVKISSEQDNQSNNNNCSLLIAHCSFICDRENLEMLLRLSRKKARVEIKEAPASALIPFLAARQGLLAENAAAPRPGSAVFCKALAAYPVPAKLWETEIFPARENYSPEIIDRELQRNMVWYGAGKERIGLCRTEDLDLALPPVNEQKKDSSVYAECLSKAIQSGFFDHERGFWEIKEKISAMSESFPGSRECIEALWEKAWQGRISADSFEPVRRGLENGFVPKAAQNAAQRPEALSGAPFAPRHAKIPHALRNRWKEGAPVHGSWFSISFNDQPEEGGAQNSRQPDPLDEECRNRDRVRLLLARWGILCRPLLEHESPLFAWSNLLPAMRRMELSGELVAGRFFSGINSLQFTSPAIVRELGNANRPAGLYWMNAADPASPAGLAIEGLDPRIPARLPSSRLYFRGENLAAVTNKNGKDLHLFIEPGDSILSALIDLLKVPRTRKVSPEKKLVIETINGTEAAKSNFAQAFLAAGFIPDRGKLFFW